MSQHFEVSKFQEYEDFINVTPFGCAICGALWKAHFDRHTDGCDRGHSIADLVAHILGASPAFQLDDWLL